MAKHPVELTEAEWTIIKAVWKAEPCTATATQKELHAVTRWSYSTVRTMMDRMVFKGILTSKKVKGITHYRSKITRRQAQRGELLYTLKHAFNGALAPMVQGLLETKDLSSAQLDEIKQIIADHQKARGGASGGKS